MVRTIASAAEQTRPVFEGIGTVGQAVFYVLSFLTIGVFTYGFWRRYRKYKRGRPAGRARNIRRALLTGALAGVGRRSDTGSAAVIAANATIARRDRVTGLAHLLVFWGFITLFVGTVILTIDYDIVRHASRLLTGEEASFFVGTFYIVYSVVLDTMGLAAVVGLGYLAVRRGLMRPRRLDYTRAEQPDGGYSRRRVVLGDWVFLGLFGGILVSGFLLEGFRLLAAEFPSFEVWSPVGWATGRGLDALGVGAGAAETGHYLMWWTHALAALGFVAYIPYSKAMHMVLDAVNLLASDTSTARSLPAPPASNGTVGYHRLADFTWKELLDLDSCTKCGRCHDVCPARTGGAPLSPRDLILDLRQWADTSTGGRTLLDRESRPNGGGPVSAGDADVAGGVIPEETLWSCTTCMACVAACPVGIEHVPTIVSLRRGLVDAGSMGSTLQQALQNLTQQGNSFGKSSRMRARWTRGLDFTVKDARKEKVEYLWFVGDFASFDERVQDNTRTLARLLNEAGVDFGLLYDGEHNAGNDVRRVGEEGLYDLLAEHNVSALESAQFEQIFTTDPHSLNTLRNEYPQRGGTYTVWHYTELLARLLESGVIPVRPLGYKVTYHDPCYLARYNGVTEAPRRVLKALGCELVEMPRNRDNTFCCGAGGGRIWMDDANYAERPSENRIREAVTLDVDYFVVSCPKDMTMYADAVKTTGHEERLQVVDVVGLVDEASGGPGPGQTEPETAGVAR